MLLSEHFGSHVLGATAIGRSQIIGSYPFFAQSKISYLEIALNIDHNILGLNVTVNDVLTVQILNS